MHPTHVLDYLDLDSQGPVYIGTASSVIEARGWMDPDTGGPQRTLYLDCPHGEVPPSTLVVWGTDTDTGVCLSCTLTDRSAEPVAILPIALWDEPTPIGAHARWGA